MCLRRAQSGATDSRLCPCPMPSPVRQVQRKLSLALLLMATKNTLQPGLISHIVPLQLSLSHIAIPQAAMKDSYPQAVPLCQQYRSKAEKIGRNVEYWLQWPRKEVISNSVAIKLCSRNSAIFQICSFSKPATFLGCFLLCLISLDMVSSSILQRNYITEQFSDVGQTDCYQGMLPKYHQELSRIHYQQGE